MGLFRRIFKSIAFRMAAAILAALALGCALAAVTARPEPSDGRVKRGGKLMVDCAPMADGYLYVSAPALQGGSKRLKVRVSYENTDMDYDLPAEGAPIAVPLPFGSGSYSLILYRQLSGTKYRAAGRVNLEAQLSREDAAFLSPNVYVSYTAESPAALKALELTEGLTDQGEIYNVIREYVLKNFMYDYIRALTVESGTLPSVEDCFEKRRGICQDLCALTVCMLRVNGIPAKLVIGHADRNYHAWVTAEVDGEERLFDPTAELTGSKNRPVYTAERIY